MQWITLALLLLENDVKTKIQSLRTYYSKELTKEKFGRNKSGSGASDVYMSKWPHFKSL